MSTARTLVCQYKEVVMVAPDTRTRQVCPDCNRPMNRSNDMVGIPTFSGPAALDMGRILALTVFACDECGLVKLYSAVVLRGESLTQKPQS